MKMFDEAEVSAELDQRLIAAGVDPTDGGVQVVKNVISAYYAERTSEVLQKVRDVLDRMGGAEGLH